VPKTFNEGLFILGKLLAALTLNSTGSEFNISIFTLPLSNIELVIIFYSFKGMFMGVKKVSSFSL